MTLATTIPIESSYIQQYGNKVTISVADPLLRTEVYRAPDNGSGAPNDAASVSATVLAPSILGDTVSFIDPLPNDGTKRFYKSRHIDENGNVSAFTAYSDGQAPVLIATLGTISQLVAYGAIVDALPPATLYEIRMANSFPDPDTVDGIQSYIDMPATTNFLRLGKTPKAISSSTNASPIVMTVTGHGYSTGDRVTIRGHLVNTNANGTFAITVIDANTFSLNGSTGNGTGAATGHSVRLALTIDPNGNLAVYGTIASPFVDLGNKSASFNIDLSAGVTQKVQLGANAIPINLQNAINGARYGLILQQDATGGRTLPVFNPPIMWAADTAPSLTGDVAGGATVLELWFQPSPAAFYGLVFAQNVQRVTPLILSGPTGTGFASSTTHNVPMPATVNAGDFLIVIISFSGNSTKTDPTGWTRLGSTNNTFAWSKVADGTEGGTNVNFATSVAESAAAVKYRLGQCSGATLFQGQSGAPSANPDPPANTPSWGAERNLWIAGAGYTGNSIVSAFSTGYTNTGSQNDSAAACAIAFESRTLFAASENPSALTLSASQTWGAFTIAVRPTA